MGEEAQTSPKNRVKFLCSHGGKILPRPSDGQLKYVGGETRVVAFPRSITFSELKKKLNTLVEGDAVLKYQMMPEDLDALVSVKNDEDLKHMIDEYDRQSGGGSPRFRAFLFPPTPMHIINQHSSTTHSNTDDSNSKEQRYIDAINGIVRTNSNTSTGRPTGTISSASSSPRSFAPETSAATETANQESVLYDGASNPCRPFGGIRSSRMKSMHKVHSSPSLFSLGQQQNQHQQQQQQHLYHHQQQYNNQFRVSPRLPVSPRISPKDGGQHQSRYYYEASQQKATGACSGCCGHVDGLRAAYRNGGFGDPDSMPHVSMKQMGAEGSKWMHGFDYRER